MVLGFSCQVPGATELEIPPFPEPISNNAVATVTWNDSLYLVSFMGLAVNKTWKDIRKSAYLHKLGTTHWQSIEDVPVDQGRLASVAVGIGVQSILFGGYTINADGSEISTPDVIAYDLSRHIYRELASIPVPSDDAIALVYKDLYVYLISGWHNSGNINLVQVYDSHKDRWYQATPYPGSPVFGHSGGIVQDTLLVCGGVRMEFPLDGKPQFLISNDCYIGKIDQKDFRRIHWRRSPTHSGQGLYRAAANGFENNNSVVFVGGSSNPYNYNGIGYNGKPSEPSNKIHVWNFSTATWLTLENPNPATMDHRSLLVLPDGFAVIGGMEQGQKSSPKIRIIHNDVIPSQNHSVGHD